MLSTKALRMKENKKEPQDELRRKKCIHQIWRNKRNGKQKHLQDNPEKRLKESLFIP